MGVDQLITLTMEVLSGLFILPPFCPGPSPAGGSSGDLKLFSEKRHDQQEIFHPLCNNHTKQHFKKNALHF